MCFTISMMDWVQQKEMNTASRKKLDTSKEITNVLCLFIREKKPQFICILVVTVTFISRFLKLCKWKASFYFLYFLIDKYLVVWWFWEKKILMCNICYIFKPTDILMSIAVKIQIYLQCQSTRSSSRP